MSTGAPADIVAFHSQFFNVVAELFPSLTDLHYGLTPPEAAGHGWWGLMGRLRAGPTRLLDRVTDLSGMAGWPRTHRGLDLGCGLGGTSLHLSRRFGFEMVGVNINRDQLRMAEARLAGRPGADRVTLRHGDVCHLPFADASFDFAVMIEVAFHLRDKARLFSEVARVLAPGGRFVLVDQEGRERQEVMGLFWFAAEGDYRDLAAGAGLDTRAEADLTADVARWMTDYARTASLPFHAGAVAAALVRGGPDLAWRYLRGVHYFSRMVLAELASRGMRVGLTHPLSGVQLLRRHTAAELERGTMRYKAFVFDKPGAAPAGASQ